MTATLIGRDHPAGVLRAEIGRATESHGGLVLVAGEAGIGKTTLVTDAVAEARRRGALVLSGSCWDSESAPGYWPWMQVVRGLRRAGTSQEWAAAEEAAGSGLAVLLGEAAGRDGDPPERFRLYDAVTTALVSVSQLRPVVVVLEDLHWADTASLRLLEFAAQHTWFERLLLLGTYRDVEVEAVEHPLRALMSPLLSRATTVTLTGLDRADVGRLMTRTAGREPDTDLVAEVHRRTGGNPFFVEQTARLWHSGNSVTAVAPGIRDALRRRLSMLPAPVGDLLSGAAVLGREFHRQVLAAAVAQPVAHVDRLLDTAVAARLVAALGGGRFAFAHDLVRETLYDALDEPAARCRHAAVVRALDRSPTLAGRPLAVGTSPRAGTRLPADTIVPANTILPADLARHAYLAGAELDPERAVHYLLAAARDAGRRMAFDESIGHLRRALERVTDPRKATTIRLDLGSELQHIGDRDGAQQQFERAIATARELDDAELLARVALTIHRACQFLEPERTRLDLVEEAHRRLVRGGAPPGRPLSPDLLLRQLSTRVAVLARKGADDEGLAFGLWARHDAIWGLGTAAERTVLTDELITVARRAGDLEMEQFAASLRWVALLEQGDPRYLDQYRAFLSLTDRDDTPRFRLASSIDQSIIRGFQGEFAEAEALLDHVVHASNEHAQEQDPLAFMLEQLRWSLGLIQGRSVEPDRLQLVLARHNCPYPWLPAGISALQQGDLDAGLRHLAEVAPDAGPLSRSYEPLGLRYLAMAAAATREPELCERARSALAPYSGEWLVSLYGCDIGGPVDLWRALVDAAQEHWPAAIDGFTAACRSADRLCSRPWSVEARAHLGATLLARGAAGDAERAAALLDRAALEATELGMPHVVRRIAALRGAPAAGVVSPRPTAGAKTPAEHTTAQAEHATAPAGPATAQAEHATAPAGPATAHAEHATAPAGPDTTGAKPASVGLAKDGPPAGPEAEAGAPRPAVGAAAGAPPPSPEVETGAPRPAVGTVPEAPPPRPEAAGAPRNDAGTAVDAPPAGADPPLVNRFRRDGAVWALEFAGRSAHLPDAKGLRDLHLLLSRPGLDIRAAELLNPDGGELVVAARRLGADPILDEEAKVRYKRRLTQLDEVIDRAAERGDQRRAVEFGRERDALLAELRAAAGLAGRSRRLGDESERARKTVTARIRDVLRKLDDAHPELAAHLRATVSTGSTCCYRPDGATTWRL